MTTGVFLSVRMELECICVNNHLKATMISHTILRNANITVLYAFRDGMGVQGGRVMGG